MRFMLVVMLVFGGSLLAIGSSDQIANRLKSTFQDLSVNLSVKVEPELEQDSHTVAKRAPGHPEAVAAGVGEQIKVGLQEAYEKIRSAAVNRTKSMPESETPVEDTERQVSEEAVTSLNEVPKPDVFPTDKHTADPEGERKHVDGKSKRKRRVFVSADPSEVPDLPASAVLAQVPESYAAEPIAYPDTPLPALIPEEPIYEAHQDAHTLDDIHAANREALTVLDQFNNAQ